MTQEQHGVYRLKQYSGVPLSFLPDQFARPIIDNLNSPFLSKICTAWVDHAEYIAPVPARDPRAFPHLNDGMRSLQDPPLCYFDGEYHLVKMPLLETVPVGALYGNIQTRDFVFSTYRRENHPSYSHMGGFRRQDTFFSRDRFVHTVPRLFSRRKCDWNGGETGNGQYFLFVVTPPDKELPFTLITNPLLPFTFDQFLLHEKYAFQRKLVSSHMRTMFPDDPRCDYLDQILSQVWDPLVTPPLPS